MNKNGQIGQRLFKFVTNKLLAANAILTKLRQSISPGLSEIIRYDS